jgi:Lrp/AsnC family leucine-responsive transcriptional regulator
MMHKKIDPTDAAILEVLQADARSTPAQIARRLKLDKDQVAQRIARLEKNGVIQGYHARIDPAALGHGITAFVRVTSRGFVTPIEVVASQLPGIVECHSVTGEHDSLVKVVAPNVPELEKILVELMRCGVTSTALVLSSPLAFKALQPVP